MRAYALGQLKSTPTLRAHIDHCLGCQACEAACPSQVPYDTLLTDTRALLAADASHPFGHHTLLRATQSPRLLAALYDAARAGTQTGLIRLLPYPLRALPRLPPRPAYHRPRPVAGRHAVSLFLGCSQRLEGDALAATLAILRYHRFAVSIPRRQGCCGALARHAGDAHLAARQEAQNRQAFADGPGPVIGFTSGCVAALRADRQNGDPQFLQEVQDVHQFLAERVPAADWRLTRLPKVVAVHEPCSLRNALKTTEAVYALLRHIPDAQIVPLPENKICCGGAGDYFLREPVIAAELRTAKQKVMSDLKPDLVVSANIGCRLQLRMGDASPIPIIHPLVLLARQLGSASTMLD